MPNFKTSDNLTLHYTDTGKGLPILCLAGLTRNSGDFDYIDGLLGDVRLIKMDYRGRGRSDWATDHSSYSIPRESLDALELMDHLGIARFAIIGSSRGGLCAMALGATQMDRLLGVALNDIGPELAAAALEDIKNFVGQPPIWQNLDSAASARAEIMQGFANVPDGRWREECAKIFVQTDAGLINAYDPKLRDAVLEASLQPIPDLWPFFNAFAACPTALIRGANSPLLTQETFDKMQAALPEAIAVNVPDRGHIPFLDEPAALDALRQWIDQIRLLT
ncbi:alpha/beta hydrolase [Cognatishimia sp. SS12]|uniref:alpha/beta fold hydrolase n=1 Tax=Cognatishimia sp. SS12 TaxID=2979465 RepID=UPI00232BAF0C|nr:alpha/beta hydrolase [Cognatishimia sp. SS12]MDC0738764.1 alpha/beta hydrolase [Cognatishimia sp. SS12]